MSSAALPTSRRFVTELLNSLPALSLSQPDNSAAAEAEEESSHPLGNVPDNAKKQLLTLQVLFPNEFVPALDLLDRRLVTRLRLCNSSSSSSSDPLTDGPRPRPRPRPVARPHDTLSPVYYVRSAQQRSSRYSTSYETSTSYEVRLTAWNCSCPAFAFAAFPAVHPEPEPKPALSPWTCIPNEASLGRELDSGGGGGWVFGGITLDEDMPPVCKHLLACVLAEKCSPLFGAFVEERHVSVEEAAAWAAGWGD